MPTRLTLTRLTLIASYAVAFTGNPANAQVKWSVEATPRVTLGSKSGEGLAEFAVVNGATLLPDGNIIVGDVSDYSMFIVAADNRVIKKFGRKGTGPGELTFPFWTMRCGNFVFVQDGSDGRVLVFALDGQYVRSFRWGSGVDKLGPYRSSCNQNAQFAHYGWDRDKDMKAGIATRSPVNAWITPGDSSSGKLLGKLLGSERWENRPLPLGKEPRIVLATNRVYLAEATTYEIGVLTLDGKPLPSIRKAVKPVTVTAQDVSDDLERLVSTMGEKNRKFIAQQYSAVTMPKTLPPYRSLLVDAEQNLWVQDYARSGVNSVMWTVFNSQGKQMTEIVLPYALEPYEVGKDYVLGRYVDPDVSVPEVRMYKLTKRP